ncbi:right-handed parallel beta-helix repeat-containing protein, partial [bacterium]|nr:right-handed parallel beta-helix repeat-containing protein [candidate division CSSED10-310 bacterium]
MTSTKERMKPALSRFFLDDAGVERGQDLYVDCTNAAGPWDGTETNPYASIGSALQAASYGDCVWVLPCTYYESLQVPAGVMLISALPRQAVIESGAQYDQAVVAGGNSLVGDFGIRHSSEVGVLCMENDAVIFGNDIEGASGTIGIVVTDAEVVITENDIHDHMHGVLLSDGASARVFNNKVYDISEVAFFCDDSSPNIIHNTVNNVDVGIKVSGGSSPNINSNILAECQSYGLVRLNTQKYLFRYNNLWGNDFNFYNYPNMVGRECNTEEEPAFISAGDFRLRIGSRCIGAGDPGLFSPTRRNGLSRLFLLDDAAVPRGGGGSNQGWYQGSGASGSPTPSPAQGPSPTPYWGDEFHASAPGAGDDDDNHPRLACGATQQWLVWHGWKSGAFRILYNTHSGTGAWVQDEYYMPTTGLTQSMEPDIALDDGGDPWIVWSATTQTGRSIVCSKWSSGSFSSTPEVVSLSETTDYDGAPAIAINDTCGEAWVVWSGYNSQSASFDIYYSTNSGSGWSNRALVATCSDDDMQPAIALDSSGDPVCV